MDYKKDLLTKLPELKNIEGFPIGKDEDIIALSEPPYFTACPNPYIADFIKEHGTPYNEETDNYHCEPFVGDVSEGKNDPLYNIHSYHTKVPFKAIIKYINHYTKENDIVLDGFAGTGMTGVASQQINRKAVLSDLSPIASFISFNYNNTQNLLNSLVKGEEILVKLENENKWLYETVHFADKNRIQKGKVIDIIWSDVLICPYCKGEMIFWDVAMQDGSVKDIFDCPHCIAQLKKNLCDRKFINAYDDILNINRIVAEQVPVLVNYVYNKRRYSKRADEFDLELINKINETKIAYFVPIDAIPSGYNTNQPIKSHKISNVFHFFTKRNLIILSKLYDLFKDESLLLFLYTSILNNLTKRYRYRTTGGGGPTGNLYLPSLNKELNPFFAYFSKINSFKDLIERDCNNSIISTQSATNFKNIPENSIDYIFTDPPFGDNIMYSEMNFIWESWLKVRTNNSPEAIINKEQNKELNEYNHLMFQSFTEYYRVLKPKRWMTVIFHNSKSAVWNGIQDAITKAGFLISQVTTLDKQQGSFKQVTAPGAVANDLVISAFKPSYNFDTHFAKSAGENLEALFLEEFLSNLPISPKIERTDKMLYSKMIAYYIQRGYEIRYDAKSFYSLLNKNFAQEDGFWFTANQINSYLEYKRQQKLEGIDEVKSGEMYLFVSDEKSALVWLYNFLSFPKSFSDISTAFNQTANIQGDLVPDLRELLDQNFIFEGSQFRRPNSEPEHNLLAEKRERLLMKEFETLLIQAQTEKKKIKDIRKEALAFGFETCYKNKRYNDILTIATKLDKSILENSGELNDFVQAAEIMINGVF